MTEHRATRVVYCDKPTGGSGWFDSALFYAGSNPYRFADVFAPYGRVVML